MPLSELHEKILGEAQAQRGRSRDLGRGERRDRALARGRAAAPARVPINLSTATLAQIAAEIVADWRPVNYAAVPYLEALGALNVVNPCVVNPCVVNPCATHYGADDAAGIVRYFLSNARTWRGPVAKAVKAELNRRVAR